MSETIFKLPAGVTGVTSETDVSEHSFSRFKSATHEAARRAGVRASGFEAAGVSPNFHQAQMRLDSTQCTVVCNAVFGFVAFAGPSDNAKFHFVDNEELSRSFKLQGYKVLQSSVLKVELNDDNCSDLAEAEIRELKYWKCTTIGEAVFNWID